MVDAARSTCRHGQYGGVPAEPAARSQTAETSLVPGPPAQLLGQACLADARLAQAEHDAWVAVERRRETVRQHGELALPSDQLCSHQRHRP